MKFSAIYKSRDLQSIFYEFIAKETFSLCSEEVRKTFKLNEIEK